MHTEVNVVIAPSQQSQYRWHFLELLIMVHRNKIQDPKLNLTQLFSSKTTKSRN